MAEIAVSGLKFCSLAKPIFFCKKYASEQFEAPMNIEIIIRKTFRYFGHNFKKKTLFLPF